jgi:hypothetical protein
MTRIDPAKVEAMTDASKEDLPPARPTPARRTAGNGELAKDPLSPEIEFDTFRRRRPARGADRQGRTVEGADKLLRLTLDIGDEQRNVFSGIKSAYPTRPSWMAPDHDGRQPQAPEDEVRHVRRHGDGGRPWRRRNLPAEPGQRRQAGSAHQVSPAAKRSHRHVLRPWDFSYLAHPSRVPIMPNQ